MRGRQDSLRTCQYRCALIANGEGQQRWISFLAIAAQVRQPGTAPKGILLTLLKRKPAGQG